MNRERLPSGLAMVLLSALFGCAGDGAAHERSASGPAYEGEGQFPVQADLIDDIRGALGGESAGAGATGVPTLKTGIPQHGNPPVFLGDGLGPYRVDSYGAETGTVYYPVNAPPPFAGLSLCGGFLNLGYEMSDWGPFYASWGIVTIITDTGLFDDPTNRGGKLAASVEELKRENNRQASPLYKKMAGRYGTSGYSMGGGGTTFASAADWKLNVSIGMAPWLPTGFLIQTPTLLMCGDIDIIAPCEMAESAYDEIPDSTPKMFIMLGGGLSHLGWFGPGAGWGKGGGLGLAFAKLYLEGDERWKAPLLNAAGGAYTNIR